MSKPDIALANAPSPDKQAQPLISFAQVDIVFPPAKQAHSKQAEALRMLDSGSNRQAILKATGAVVGAANVSLDITQGSTCVLMGLSGSGKSTLLRTINGLNSVTRGHVWLGGSSNKDGDKLDIAHISPRQLCELRKSRISMVFQQFALLPWKNVHDNVAFGLALQGKSRAEIHAQVMEQLQLVGLEQWADKPIHALSGGMQQRVGLARAFATDADILLMDEPFSALDPLIRQRLQGELVDLQRRLKKTIVFVSHDLDEAMRLGDTIVILESGRVVQAGTARDIVFSPANEYVRRFVENINPLSVVYAEVIMAPLAQAHSQLKSKWGLRLFTARGELGDAHAVSNLTIHKHNGGALKVHRVWQEYMGESARDGRKPLGEPGKGAVAIMHHEAPMTSLLRAARQTEYPLLVEGKEGGIVGVIDDNRIFDALIGDISTPTATDV